MLRSVRERAWRVEASVEQLAVHYTCDGWLLHTSSEDAQRQLAANKAAAEAAEVAARPAPVPLGKVLPTCSYFWLTYKQAEAAEAAESVL